jgi:hypothetical protein
MDASGCLGFRKPAEGISTLKNIMDLGIKVNINHATIVYAGIHSGENTDATYIFFPKNEKVSILFKDYQKYLLALKKYNIISRHKTVEPPLKTVVNDFMENGQWNKDFYDITLDNCLFVAKANYSGEHGSPSYEIFTRYYDEFCKQIPLLINEDIQYLPVANISEIPYH